MEPEVMSMQRRVAHSGGRSIGMRSAVRGQSITEFVIVIPVLLLMVLGTLQLALIYMAKSTLNQAAMSGARQGAVNHASLCSMRRGVVKGLTPLYLNTSDSDSTLGYYETRARAWGKTMLGVLGGLDNVKITVLNPSSKSFTDFAVANPDDGGKKEIPNSRLMYRSTTLGSQSGQTIQDANLLKIRVQYCYRMIVPYVSTVLATLHKGDSGFTHSCYVAGGAALSSYATVLMQSPARKSSTIEKIGLCLPFTVP
jgi:hypothetical protein